MSETELLKRREQLLGAAPLFYQNPVHLVKGEGVLLYDESGKEYIDLYNNVPCVGHANPHVVDAMQRQMSTLNVHSRYLHEGVVDYAERLLDLHPGNFESVIFACSGTEASEIALMMARFATGGKGIICTDSTYHGNSAEVRKMTLATSLNSDKNSEFRAIPFPQTYRPLADNVSPEELCDLYVAKVQAAIDDFENNNIPFAGMFICSIFANEGLPTIPVGFMEKAVALVHKAGGVVIADEVQAGFCRSGKWWGYQTSGFTPDIVTMGKPMGNGLPVSAVAASADLVKAFRKNTRYFNTFSSSPLQAATGMAVLDVIENENLLVESAAVGSYLRTELATMASNYDFMAQVRGCGLFTGIEWVSNAKEKTADLSGAMKVANSLKDKGFLLSNAGALGNVIKIRPPLVFKKKHADLFLTAFKEMLAEF